MDEMESRLVQRRRYVLPSYQFDVIGLKFLAAFTNGLNHLYGTHLCLVFAEIKPRTECRIQLCARYEVNSFEQSISIETIGLWAKKSE